MRIKVYKVCGLFVSAIVFGVIKIADAIFDGFYWLKSFAVNLWKLWKLIWTGFEFQNIGRVLMLSLGAFVGAIIVPPQNHAHIRGLLNILRHGKYSINRKVKSAQKIRITSYATISQSRLCRIRQTKQSNFKESVCRA